jgi:DNA-binding MarR family transcriptional regulator
VEKPGEMLDAAEEDKYRVYVPFVDGSYNFLALMYLAHETSRRARLCQLKDVGLTNSEFELLVVLEGLGQTATPGEIARWMRRRSSTTTALLHRMEKSGLVIRKRYPKSKKLKMVVMTELGAQALARGRSHDITHRIIGSLTREDRAQLWSLLEKVRGAALGLMNETERERRLSRGQGDWCAQLP